MNASARRAQAWGALVHPWRPTWRGSNDASDSSTALQIARRLIDRQSASGSVGDAAHVAAALQRACVRLSDDLRNTLGADGSRALFARALARTASNHSALTHIRRLDAPGIRLEEVAASIEAYGVAPVTAAIEALLATLVDILVRLIGEDRVTRLIDPDAPESRHGVGAPAP